MFITALKQAFSRWWDKLGYATINSAIAAVNPFFLFLHLSLLWILTHSAEVVKPNIPMFILLLPTAFLIQGFFPTAFATMDYNKKISENESIYLRKLPHDLWQSFKSTFINSLKFTLIFGILGILLGFNLIFYDGMLQDNPFRWILLIIAAWIYLIFALIQYVLPALVIYNPELKTTAAFKYALSITVAFGLPIILIFIIDSVVFLLMVMTRYFSPFVYFGISSFLRIHLHKTIVAYLRKQENKNKPKTKTTEIDPLDSWSTILNKDRKITTDSDSK